MGDVIRSDPDSYLFLVFDIVGSTQIKEDMRARSQSWVQLFQFFYQDFPRKIDEAQDAFCRSLDAYPAKSLNCDCGENSDGDGSAGASQAFSCSCREWATCEVEHAKLQLTRIREDLRLWRVHGDEVVYMVPISSFGQVFYCVRLWKYVIEHLNIQYDYESTREAKTNKIRTLDAGIDEVDDAGKLKFRAGIFAACCPEPDSRVAVPRIPDSRPPVGEAGYDTFVAEAFGELNYQEFFFDMMGPSLDAGYRVVGQSTKRHLTMSVDVAGVYCDYLNQCHQRGGKLLDDLFPSGVNCLGKRVLKGVLRGREYPIFALEIGSSGPGADPRESAELGAALQEIDPQVVQCAKVVEIATVCREIPGWVLSMDISRQLPEHFSGTSHIAMA